MKVKQRDVVNVDFHFPNGKSKNVLINNMLMAMQMQASEVSKLALAHYLLAHLHIKKYET